jgi:hypothetical protein
VGRGHPPPPPVLAIMCGHVHLAWSCARACRVAASARGARRAERALWPAQREILGIYRSLGSFSSGKRRRVSISKCTGILFYESRGLRPASVPHAPAPALGTGWIAQMRRP